MQSLQLPTRDDVLELPRWARVAFAVRCARQVQPLLVVHLPDAGVRAVQAVERAIHLAGNVAIEAPVWAPDKVVIRLHAAFVATSKFARSVKQRSPLASAVSMAAAQAAASAESACCQGRVKDATAGAKAAAAAVVADPSCLESVCRYWQEFLTIARAEGWTNESPVPEHFFDE